jgi:hypothetical protein
MKWGLKAAQRLLNTERSEVLELPRPSLLVTRHASHPILSSWKILSNI